MATKSIRWLIGDEPFFFIMGLMVCPIAYLIGTVGSVVLFIRGKEREGSHNI